MAQQQAPSSAAAMDASAAPIVFEMPAPPVPRPLHLYSSQDLLGMFNLHAAYDKYVRPSIKPIEDVAAPELLSAPASAVPPALRNSSTPFAPNDKGKGRRVDTPPPQRLAAATPPASTTAIKLEPGLGHPALSAPADAGEDGGRKRKKEQTYKHLTRHLPGKHSMKKDSYFTDLLRAPPKQHAPIVPFDEKTLLKAFSIKEPGVHGYNKATIVGMDEKEKEAKKRRKEEKRAAKERARLIASGQLDPMSPIAGPSTPNPSLGNLVGSGMIINRPSAAAATPRSSVQQVGTPISRRTSIAAAPSGPSAAATPSATAPGPARSRSSTPKPVIATSSRQPSVKVETPAPTIPAPIRNASSASQPKASSQPKAASQQQKASSSKVTPDTSANPAANNSRPNNISRPGSVVGQQKAAQQRTPGTGPPTGAARPVAGGSSQPRGSVQQRPSQQQSQQQQRAGPSSQPAQGQGQPNRARPPAGSKAGTPTATSGRPLAPPGPVRGTIRKEREDDVPPATSSGRSTPAGGAARPAKKPRLDSTAGQGRRPQPTAQMS